MSSSKPSHKYEFKVSKPQSVIHAIILSKCIGVLKVVSVEQVLSIDHFANLINEPSY